MKTETKEKIKTGFKKVGEFITKMKENQDASDKKERSLFR